MIASLSEGHTSSLRFRDSTHCLKSSEQQFKMIGMLKVCTNITRNNIDKMFHNSNQSLFACDGPYLYEIQDEETLEIKSVLSVKFSLFEPFTYTLKDG